LEPDVNLAMDQLVSGWLISVNPSATSICHTSCRLGM
jgi:hypothetical protein